MSVRASDALDALPADAGAPDARLVVVRRRAGTVLLLTLALLLVVAAVALLRGAAAIAPGTIGRIVLARTTGIRVGEWPAGTEQIVWQIRVPRVLLAGLVGGALAMAGTAYQGVFRNPLAEPYVIGVAGGAGLGATLVFVSPVAWSWHGLSLVTPAAFAGALAGAGLAYSLARAGGAASGAGLILAGVAIAAMCNAATSFLFFFDNTRLATIFAWLMGGFNVATWSRVWVMALYALPCVAVLAVYARLLNVLLLDEEQARQLGVDVERVKLVVLAAASLAAAAAVSVSGLIGFVGLIVPHVARLLVGPDHRRLLPVALAGGALLLIAADLAARTVLAPAELPVGVVTAFMGGPFFLYLLRRRGRTA